MKARSFRFPLTTAALGIAAVVLGAGLIWHINLIEVPLHFLEEIEKNQIDDILTVLLLIGAGIWGDRAIEARRALAGVKAERFAAIQHTMQSVRVIVDDFLSQLHLLRVDVKVDAKRFGPLEALMFKNSVDELASKLNAVEGFRIQNV